MTNCCYSIEEELVEVRGDVCKISMLICNSEKQLQCVQNISKEKYAPCSSFKLPLATISFETGILKDENEPAWVSRADHDLALESWKGLHTPKSWIKNSVVWYSQELTPFLGVDRIQEYLREWNYGNQDISGDMDRGDPLQHFWLDSSLQISVKEQVLFIYKILNGQFKIKTELEDQIMIKPETFEMIEKLFFMQDINDWSIYGKTGSGRYNNSDNPEILMQHGWFVGWALKEREEGVDFYPFAIHIIEPYNTEKSAGVHAKEIMLKKLSSILG